MTPTSGPGAGLDNGLDGAVVGMWLFKGFFGPGTGVIPMAMNPTGMCQSIDGKTWGEWSTDHNGLQQPAACMFVTLTQMNPDGTPNVINRRLNFGNIGQSKTALDVFPGPTSYVYDANLVMTVTTGNPDGASAIKLPPSF